MKVASIQMSVVEGDKTATIDKAIENIHRCEGNDLVILPEIWNIGFMSFHRYLSEAEDSTGQTLKRLRAAAKEAGLKAQDPRVPACGRIFEYIDDVE